MAALLLTHGFPPDVGGVQSYLYARCVATPHEIAVVAPDRPGAAEFDPAQPFPVRRWREPPGLARPMQVLGPLLESRGLGEVEWVECGTVLPVGLPAYALSRRLGVPYLIWTHGQELFRAEQSRWNALGSGRLMRFLLGHARAVMANSRATADLAQSLGVDAGRIHVLHPPAIPLDESRGPGIREQLGLRDRPFVLSVSRLVRRKGHEALLRAVWHARLRHPELACVLVGEGPERAELERCIPELGLEGHAFLPGRIENLGSAYREATVFALLSEHIPEIGWWEGFGIVFREAGLFGLPVVGTRAGGIPDAIVDGETGFLVDDIDEAADAIVRLVEDPELAKRMGERGGELAARQPDWSVIRAAMSK